MKKIKIFDTTLRDGEQSPGCKMTIEEKVKIAQKLEQMGVDIIEAGFAASSANDKKAIEQIASTVEHSCICSLARCNKNDIIAAKEALKEAKHKRIHVFIATSDIHMQYKLKMPKEEVVNKVEEAIVFAKQYFDDIEFSCEDATRSDLNFMLEVINKAIEVGATTINIPDTVGTMPPIEYYNLIKSIKNNISNPAITLSAHTHNDLGMATATTMMGILAGIEQVECTINGIGERAGNTSLEQVVANIKTCPEYYKATTTINTKMIYEVCQLVADITNSSISRTQPIVGANAFKHESGIHQHGVINNALTYEIMNPKDYGITTDNIVIGIHSGSAAIIKKISDYGKNSDDYDIAAILKQIKEVLEYQANITSEEFLKIIDLNIIKRKSLK